MRVNFWWGRPEITQDWGSRGDRQGRLGSRSWVCSTPKELHEAVFSMSEARLLAWFVGGGGNQPIAQNPVQIESLEGHTRT